MLFSIAQPISLKKSPKTDFMPRSTAVADSVNGPRSCVKRL